MNKTLDSLHTKILKSKFAEEVTETEIEALVTAKNNGWIPCSELLPEEAKVILICTKTGMVDVGARNVSYEHNAYRTSYRNNIFWDDEVIAWQPLPQPYKPQQESEWKDAMMKHFTKVE